jgi:xanthine dehydrogenase accessory factor
MNETTSAASSDWTRGDWRGALVELEGAGIPHILVTIVSAKGSTPRAAGTKMVVAADGIAGSIGGGTLERLAIETARRLLAEGATDPFLENQTLGIEQDQCCGGATSVLFEPMAVSALRLALFGAGHVGRALVRVLDGTGVNILWIDEREEHLSGPLPGSATPVVTGDPAAEVVKLPAGTHVRVMTHSHARDFEIIDALLACDDLASIGLIGSKSKWGNFRSRLRKKGVPDEVVNRVQCPIGLKGVGGKSPADIAIAAAAELLSLRET